MKKYDLVIADIYNTVLFPPDTKIHLDTINGLIEKYSLDNVITPNIIKWMIAGFNLAPLALESKLSIDELRDRNLINQYESFEDAAANKKISLQLKSFMTDYSEYLIASYTLRNVDNLIKLTEGDGNLVFLSNANYFQKKIASKYLSNFPNLIFSCDMKIKKPSKVLLKTIVEHSGSTYCKTICIGDSLISDIQPALSLGIDAVNICEFS